MAGLARIMAAELDVSETYVRTLGRMASHLYKEYTIPKRAGGRRKIEHPARELKAVQRWLLLNVVESLPIHEAATAYRKGSNILSHATLHQRSDYLLRLDFRNFFSSITASDVTLRLQRCVERLPAWWSSDDSVLFCQITCRYQRLTIGAVSSPSLSNTVCFDLDRLLHERCEEEQIAYSRYSDDMFFSSRRSRPLSHLPSVVNQVIQSLSCPSGLALNPSKTLFSSRRQRRVVTGVVLTSAGGVSIGRNMKRYLRSLVRGYDGLSPEKRRWLAGFLAHARSIEPELINRMVLKYGAELVNRALRPANERQTTAMT